MSEQNTSSADLQFAPESALVTADTVEDAGDVAEVQLEILLQSTSVAHEQLALFKWTRE